ncbi:hypothetical protein RND71_032145 [Anisodus tanguticus]|uniref:Protein TIFY n=1 Tax=Anisodus tanguticus TaxID=243964 RepID=A0AAE1V6G2_9SOLA|nr:hypothetical protein RND71_032145 [Anisodus tanguticus]
MNDNSKSEYGWMTKFMAKYKRTQEKTNLEVIRDVRQEVYHQDHVYTSGPGSSQPTPHNTSETNLSEPKIYGPQSPNHYQSRLMPPSLSSFSPNNCKNIPYFSMKDQESTELEKQPQQQLTIFYNGRLVVSDVTELQAKAIIYLASREMEEKTKKTLSPILQPSSPLLQPQTGNCIKVNQMVAVPIQKDKKSHFEVESILVVFDVRLSGTIVRSCVSASAEVGSQKRILRFVGVLPQRANLIKDGTWNVPDFGRSFPFKGSSEARETLRDGHHLVDHVLLCKYVLNVLDKDSAFGNYFAEAKYKKDKESTELEKQPQQLTMFYNGKLVVSDATELQNVNQMVAVTIVEEFCKSRN